MGMQEIRRGIHNKDTTLTTSHYYGVTARAFTAAFPLQCESPCLDFRVSRMSSWMTRALSPDLLMSHPLPHTCQRALDIIVKGLISSIIDTIKWLMDCWWPAGCFTRALLRSYLGQCSPIWPTYLLDWLDWFQIHKQLICGIHHISGNYCHHTVCKPHQIP